MGGQHFCDNMIVRSDLVLEKIGVNKSFKVFICLGLTYIWVAHNIVGMRKNRSKYIYIYIYIIYSKSLFSFIICDQIMRFFHAIIYHTV